MRVIGRNAVLSVLLVLLVLHCARCAQGVKGARGPVHAPRRHADNRGRTQYLCRSKTSRRAVPSMPPYPPVGVERLKLGIGVGMQDAGEGFEVILGCLLIQKWRFIVNGLYIDSLLMHCRPKGTAVPRAAKAEQETASLGPSASTPGRKPDSHKQNRPTNLVGLFQCFLLLHFLN